MLELSSLLLLLAAIAGVLLVWFGLEPLRQTGWGRRAVLLCGGLLPLVASAATMSAGVTESSRTRFCLSCHEMQDYGKSLFVDNPQALSAVHYQKRLVDRDGTCYACHTDYAMFGDVKAKMNGLKHVWVHYFGKVPERLALYQPYPNYNCLHCHDDARGYLEAEAHRPVARELRDGSVSCLKCHNVGHDLAGAAEGRLWQAEARQ
jgi:cytochrome c-type protein NapC